MANKISIEFEAKNAEQAAAKVDKLAAAVDNLNAKTRKAGIAVTPEQFSNMSSFAKAQLAAMGITGPSAPSAGGSGTIPTAGAPAGPTGPIAFHFSRLAGAARGIPPVISPPVINPGGKINPLMIGLGLAAGAVSQFAGARILNAASHGGGGGGGGGITSALFGSGGFSGFAALYTGLKYATIALRFEFEQLAKAVERGSRLYVESHVAGRTPGQLFALQAAGRAIGLNPEQITRLATQQHLMFGGRGGGRSINAVGEMLRVARGLGDAETGTRILQQQQLFTQVYERFRLLDESVGDSSRSLFEFQANIGQLKDLFMSGLIIATGDLVKLFNLLSLAIGPLTYLVPVIVKGFEGLIASIFLGHIGNIAPQLLGLLPNALPDAGVGRLLAGSGGSRPESGWEKMGLVIQGGVNATDYAKQTADNTKKIADALTGKGALAAAKGIFDMSLTAFNLP